MARIKIDFRKPVLDQIAKSRDIQGKMAGNPNFDLPEPSLLVIETATNQLEEANLKALHGDREQKGLMRIKRKALHLLINELADYVKHASKGDELKILSSGFDVRSNQTAAAEPEAPARLRVIPATFETELRIVWKPSAKAKYYIIQIATGSPAEENFLQAGTSTRCSFTVIRLQSGVKYWFRVMALNSKGHSGWSQMASGRTL